MHTSFFYAHASEKIAFFSCPGGERGSALGPPPGALAAGHRARPGPSSAEKRWSPLSSFEPMMMTSLGVRIPLGDSLSNGIG